MSEGRFKSYDYGVLGLFVLVLIGVSLSWYTVSIALENQSLGAGASGWHFTWGVLAFVAAVIALLVVGLKALVAPGSFLPGWYKEGPLVMGLGDLVALFAIIGLIDKPGRGVDLMGMMTIGYGVGIFLTLIAGLLMGVCGIRAAGPIGGREQDAQGRHVPGRRCVAGWAVAGWVLAERWVA